uniref:dolichyl-P-Man:Man5GlcNAc2-PP-dolichol alpha-1,3-mannosyltransferase n=1 Tax=Caligus rogercresseyi TaxID=217165 RepID=C1BMF0_CALRO|nr:Dolichyl-P-Man:Man5GlcNAc2-PP-dolichyl mannosyltransferase [Caligus rogercresseyi]
MRANKRQYGGFLTSRVISLMKNLVFNPEYCVYVAGLLFLAEILLNFCIVEFVPYTEIDWIAYMQEVEGFLEGERNYTLLRGDTGPCVYPAGFIYLFSGLKALTNGGKSIKTAQYLFIVAYLVLLASVFRLIIRSRKVPPFGLVLMSLTSYRIHSIFVLRLFNDPLAMILAYIALNLFVSNQWSLGSIFFSLAVSIKMNILLFAPALLLTYIVVLGPHGAFTQLLICASLQIGLAFPFLSTFPIEYIKGSFDLGRVFNHQWTVNYRFLSEEIFVDKRFHIALLLVHLLVLALFTPSWWKLLRTYRDIKGHLGGIKDQLLLLPLFTSNFIGLVFSRSLHYQFYIWYYHQLQYLAWCTDYSIKIKLLILGLIELCWNTYPSTNWSSACLHCVHLFLLVGVYNYTKSSIESAKKIRLQKVK